MGRKGGRKGGREIGIGRVMEEMWMGRKVGQKCSIGAEKHTSV